ncbi:MAG: hypothetical protein ABFD91_11490, partial [Anaerohalosphaeraceae bacterium]
MNRTNAVKVLDMQGRAQVIYDLLKDRLDTLLNPALATDNLDMWLILGQEDNPDPIYEHLIPLDCWPPILHILVFVRTPDGIRRFNL